MFVLNKFYCMYENLDTSLFVIQSCSVKVPIYFQLGVHNSTEKTFCKKKNNNCKTFAVDKKG